VARPENIADVGSCRLSKPSNLISSTGCTQLQEIDGNVCVCNTIDVPPYLSAAERDFGMHPIPPKDPRFIIFELKRPAVRELPNNCKDVDDGTWPADLIERLRRLPESK
jgi:hypothetical protein